MDEKANCVAGPGCLICGTVMPLLNKVWVDATQNHFRNSSCEFLKGVRSLIDFQINRLAPQETKGTRVTVE